MSYLLMVLAVFWVNRTLRLYVVAPAWAYELALILTGVGAVAVWEGVALWYIAFPVAGAVHVLSHLDDLLITKADEALAAVMQRRR